MPEEPRAAGTRQEERLAQGLDSAGIVQEVKKTQEIDSTHRVYRKEFLLDSRWATEAQAMLKAESTYEGRLVPEDIDIREDADGTWVLWTRLWNVTSEWKREDLATNHASTLDPADGEVRVVARNSRREHLLKGYGTLKLVQT
jgi:hypothetical protein